MNLPLRRPVLLVASLATLLMAAPLAVAPLAAASARHLAASSKPVYGGTLNTALPVDPGTLDPRLETNTSTEAIDSLIFDGLVQIPNSLKPVPDLATSWKEISPTEWVFQLRHGVVFSNGQPFTSADVVYTYTSLLNPALKSPLIEDYEPIKQVVAEGPYTVKFLLTMPYSPLLSYLTLGIVPHIAGKNKNFSTEPVGTGPYMLKSWQVNNQVTIVTNPHYYGKKPYIPTIVFKIIPDSTTQVLGLEAGSLNFLTSPLPYNYIPQIEKNHNYVVEKTVGVGTTYLNLNLKAPFLSDLKVREALQYATNKQAIVDHLYYGIDTPASTMLIPGTWDWDASLQAPPPSMAKAEALLASDGWKKGPGGYLEKDGKTLTLTLSTYNDPTREQVVEYLQEVYSQLGIKVTTQVNEWPTFLANVLAGKYSVALIGWLDLVDPDDAFYRQFTTGGTDNWDGFSNATVNKLLNEARTESSISQRKALYVAASRIILAEVPWIIISDQAYVVMMSKTVHGYVIDRTGSLYTLADAWIG
jgi:peptide/nickel transport system substrate-binding protein